MTKTNFQAKVFIFLILLVLNSLSISNSFCQIPTDQDCKGAIAVCDYIYVEDSTAAGNGNYYEIPNGGNNCPNHCMDGEHNSRWYIWTVVESGDLRIEITPQVQTDDYDWAIFDLTDASCDDIWGNTGSILMSCNAAGGGGYQGTTGVSTPNGGSIHCNNGGPTNKWNADIPVWEGETYVLVVSDWTQTPGGYTLDFSASTAVIFDDQKPFIEYIAEDLITSCGTNELFVKFNENVKCSSLQPNDFTMEGPGGPYVIDSIYGETCELGGSNEREYTLYFSPPIYQGGDFSLEINYFSFISDACNNYAENLVYDFFIDLDSPDADAGEDIDIPYAATANLEGSAINGSGDYAYVWSPAELLDNPLISNPTTVSLTSSTEFILSVSDLQSSCQGEDTMWVNVVGGPLGITMNASSAEICNGERVDLFVFPDGGAGTYTYSWSSNPVGFTSTVQNPSDFPTLDTWYIVNVTDGFTTLIDSVQVIVNPLPVAFAGDDQVINEGTSTTLSGNGSGGYGDYNYQWEPSSWLEVNTIANPVTLPLHEPTVFTLWVTDENQCQSNPDEVLVNASGGGLAAFLLADPDEICIGESTSISSNPTGGGEVYTYEWESEPTGFTSNAEIIDVVPEVTTKYILTLKDQFGNEFETDITIIVNPLPVIDLLPEDANQFGEDSIIVCVRDSVEIDAGYDLDPPNTEYYWTKSNYVNRYYTASTNGNWTDYQTHAVRVTDGETGCINTDSLTILFDFNECAISVPENPLSNSGIVTIHPNPNDGSFSITVVNDIDNLEIQIYNSKGVLVFEDFWKANYPAGFSRRIIADLPSGIYMVNTKTSNKSSVNKVVVNKN